MYRYVFSSFYCNYIKATKIFCVLVDGKIAFANEVDMWKQEQKEAVGSLIVRKKKKKGV